MTPTFRQMQVLAFVKVHLQATGGIAPTYQEIANGLGILSKGQAQRFVNGLVDRGFLTRLPNRARSLGLTPLRAEPSIAATWHPVGQGIVGVVGRPIAIRRRAA